MATGAQSYQLTVGQQATNCYLVFDPASRDTLIIDPGDDADYIMAKLQDYTLTPRMILATHGHFDHLLAVTELKLAFTIPFYLHFADLPIYNRTQSTAHHFLGQPVDPVFQPDYDLATTSMLTFGSCLLEVLPTPGHTPGSVSFYQAQSQSVYTGDTLFADSLGATNHAYSSSSQLRTSLTKLFSLPSASQVYPGHGPSADLQTLKNLFHSLH